MRASVRSMLLFSSQLWSLRFALHAGCSPTGFLNLNLTVTSSYQLATPSSRLLVLSPLKHFHSQLPALTAHTPARSWGLEPALT